MHVGVNQGNLEKVVVTEEERGREEFRWRAIDTYTILKLSKIVEDWKRDQEKLNWESEMMRACRNAGALPNDLAIICKDFMDSIRQEFMKEEGQK